MNPSQAYIEKKNSLLTELIQNAERLREMSSQVISEQDFVQMQKRQDELLHELEKLENSEDKNGLSIPSFTHDNFHSQFLKFQKLNQEFIQNMSSHHGLIQFESLRFGEKDHNNNSHRNLSKKNLSSPDSSKTVKVEKKEKS